MLPHIFLRQSLVEVVRKVNFSDIPPFCHLVQEKLPAAKEGGEPLPEGLLWLLLTGEVCSTWTYSACKRIIEL